MTADQKPTTHISREIKVAAVDLNPIENAWDWMKDRLAENTPRASSLDMLQKQVKDLWILRMSNSSYLRSLVESMPRMVATPSIKCVYIFINNKHS